MAKERTSGEHQICDTLCKLKWKHQKNYIQQKTIIYVACCGETVGRKY